MLRAEHYGWVVIGIRNGNAGLFARPVEHERLDRASVSSLLLRLGGTAGDEIHRAAGPGLERQPFAPADLQPHALVSDGRACQCLSSARAKSRWLRALRIPFVLRLEWWISW